ncbi:PROTEIN putative-RELATED [Salix koriyanagi]|uniref:PROTEIN putative-RELATED n=1 Tax=Salix koriyanagi TaxID=2511006 RepID=A0A9Q0PWH7_9ROSI|nr:PROTEIN putative-RELATED [Salix koriyanagi]
MGKLGCGVDGNLNEAKFSEPMPWIGLYIAAASLACAIAMAADLIRGFRQQKFWFPSKYFSINATSLTIIAVAVKLSVDLNTAMPRRVDQLAKLSSGALLSTVMGNSMPSLGAMNNTDLCTNMIALGILVITVIVNIGIQLGTGVIYLYWKEQAFIMFLMLILLVILSFSALAVPINNKFLQYKYNKKYEMALKEDPNGTSKREARDLNEDLMKFWMMAHTCSPQFVVGRSVTCMASGAFCLLGAMTLAEAMLRSYLMPWSFRFCTGESEYKWSTVLVLITQTIAVGVGTIAPAIRWFIALDFRCPTRRERSSKRKLTVERYWIQLLVEMKDCPLTIRIQDRFCRKLAHYVKSKLLDICIGMQTGIVLGSKVIQFISVYFMIWVLSLADICNKLRTMKPGNSIASGSGSESRYSTKPDLSRFVLHLEGEEELVELMMKKNFDATDHWLRRGKRKQPKHLMELLEKSTVAEGFKGVKEFDSDLVLSLDCDEPPNCWALPVVTLTAIAVALPNVSGGLMKQLVLSVHEGLMYVRLIEDNLDAKGELTNLKKAANVVWLGVDLYSKWLDVDLRKLSVQAESTKEILEKLSDVAKTRFVECKKIFMNQCLKERPSKWPIKVLAANSMYRISQTLLQNCDSRNEMDDERLFEALTVMISDILGACLTNLQRVIFYCLSRAVIEREYCVRKTVHILGETEKIRKLLDQQPVSTLDPDQMACIDEWRSLNDLKISSPFIPSSANSETVFSTSSDLYLTME